MNASPGLAVVSGAASGIGLSTCRWLAARGWTVAGIDRAPVPREAAAESLRGDVTDWGWVRATLERLQDAHGPVRALVPAAGIAPAPGPVLPDDPAEGRHTIDVNVNGVLNLIHAAWPGMTRGGGAVVLVSSMAASRGSRVVSAEYTASKAAMEGLTRHLSLIGGAHGIRVNAVAPGIIRTPMTEAFGPPATDGVPLGRIGEAGEVAAVIGFLLSSEAGYVSGAVVPVTGGMR